MINIEEDTTPPPAPPTTLRGAARFEPPPSPAQPEPPAAAPATPPTVAPQRQAPPVNMNATFNPSYFECIVCLENLDSPATILEPNAGGGDDGDGDITLQQINNLLGAAGLLPAGQQPPPQPRRINQAAAKRERELAKIDPREICCTNCGK
jgi:hypothetical protein